MEPCCIPDNIVRHTIHDIPETGGGDGHDEIEVLKNDINDHSVENNSDDGRWEVVNRCKVKNKRTSQRGSGISQTKSPLSLTASHSQQVDPDPSKKIHMSTKSGNPQGRRDKNGLSNCCSCKSVHSSLPDFIHHCKSSQHNNQMVGVGDLNTKEEDLLEVKREVNDIKKGLIAVMKKGLEEDITSTMEMEQFTEGCKREMAKGSATMALMMEKLLTEIVKMDEKLSLLSAEVKRNKYGHELTKRFANIENKEKMNSQQPSTVPKKEVPETKNGEKKRDNKGRDKKCWCCSATSESNALYLCKGCKVAWYCGDKCQGKDWAVHRPWCDGVKEKRKGEKKNNKEEESVEKLPPVFYDLD